MLCKGTGTERGVLWVILPSMDLLHQEAAGQLEAAPRALLAAANSSYLHKLIWVLDIHSNCWSPQLAAARTNAVFPWSGSCNIRNWQSSTPLLLSGSSRWLHITEKKPMQCPVAMIPWFSGLREQRCHPPVYIEHFQSAKAKKELHSERKSCFVYRLLLFTNILRCNLSLFFFFCFCFSVFVWVGVCTWRKHNVWETHASWLPGHGGRK